MNGLLGTSVEDFLEGVQRRGEVLPADIGAFIALETCETLLKARAVVKSANVRISPDGKISVFAPPSDVTSMQAAQSVLRLLRQLLAVGGTTVPPKLHDLVQNEIAASDLQKLRDDLEARLVPLNREASRRVLSRFLRDAERTKGSSVPVSAMRPTVPYPRQKVAAGFGPQTQMQSSIDSPLDEPETVPRAVRVADVELDAFLNELPADVTAERDALEQIRSPEREPAREPRYGWEVDSEPAETHDENWYQNSRGSGLNRDPSDGSDGSVDDGFAEEVPSLSSLPPRESKTGRTGFLVGGFFFLASAGLIAYVLLRDDTRARLARTRDTSATVTQAAKRASASTSNATPFGDLTVRVAPARAQVFMLVGRAPVEVQNLPVGVAFEFAATFEGYEPGRAVVLPNIPWTTQPGHDSPRYELAIQARPDPKVADRFQFGSTELPRDMGKPSGKVGTVRIVTTPPNAEVYQLLGFAPEVRVENLKADRPIELVAYLDGYKVARQTIAPEDWKRVGSKKSIELTMDLTPEAGSGQTKQSEGGRSHKSR